MLEKLYQHSGAGAACATPPRSSGSFVDPMFFVVFLYACFRKLVNSILGYRYPYLPTYGTYLGNFLTQVLKY